jgi:hypothetical protein
MEARSAEASMTAVARQVPVVVLPVLWPVGADEPERAKQVQSSLSIHRRYLAGIAEIARRNGRGGFVAVTLSEKAGEVEDGGQAWRWVMADAVWRTAGLRTQDERLRRGPTQRCFTVEVEMEGGRWYASRMTCNDKLLADHLRECEELGADADTLVWCAMDGGQGGSGLMLGEDEA